MEFAGGKRGHQPHRVAAYGDTMGAKTQPGPMHHFTNKKGYDAIRATPDWCFRASQPVPPDHAFGAYFTTLGPDTPNLAYRIRVPRDKIEYMFAFESADDLIPLRGWRGAAIFFSRTDYTVTRNRQFHHGRRENQK